MGEPAPDRDYQFDFRGRVVVVRGGGARSADALGIGEVTALRFAGAGANVVVADEDGELPSHLIRSLISSRRPPA